MKNSSKIAISAAAIGAWLFAKKKGAISGIGAAHTISETQLDAYLGSHDIKELVAEYITKNKVECNIGDELGGRSFVLSRLRFIKLFNYCLMRNIPIAVWLGDHWMIRNGGEELISGIGRLDRFGGMVTVTDGTNMLNNALYGKTAAKIVFRYQGEDPVVVYWDNKYGRKGYKEVNAEFEKYFKPYNFAGADVYYGYAIDGIGFNPFEEGAQRAAAFKRAVTDMTGYKFITTFPEDFDIAERFGNAAIKDTFKRAFRSWRKDPEYLTELVLTLNHKIWQWYRTNEARAKVYDECWREADEWAVNHLKGKDLEYYYRTLD